MSSLGMKYAKRPCRGCGEPTTVRVQVRLRAIDPETRKDSCGLASKAVSLCDSCGFGVYGAVEGAIDAADGRAVA